jgi:hypothetical protein
MLYVVAGAASAVAAGVIAWKVWGQGAKVADAVADVLDAVNPTNPDNVAAKAVNSVVQAVTGDKDATLGTKIYDVLHPGENAQIQAPPPGTPATPANVAVPGGAPAPGNTVTVPQDVDPMLSIIFGGGA